MKRLLAVVVLAYAVTLGVLMHLDFGARDISLLAGTSLLFVAAVWLLARAALRPRTVALIVLGVGALLQLIALTRAPLTSDDANRYAWDAKVQLSGVDPYSYAPEAPQLEHLRDSTLFGPWSTCAHPIPGSCTSINRPDARTIYPPVAQAAFDLGRIASFGGHGGLFSYQLMAGLGALTVGWLLARRALVRGAAVWSVALWSWCPLVVGEFGNNAHLDWLAVLLSVLALQAGARARDGRAGVLLGAAIATKLYPALLLPALMRRRPWLVGFASVATVALVYLPHVIAVGQGVLGYLPGYLNEEGYDSGSRLILLGTVLPHPADSVVGALVLLAAAWWTWHRSDPNAPEQTAVLMTGIAFAVATPSYGWYAALLLALAVLSGRYEWSVLALAPSYVYLVHPHAARATIYAAATLCTLLVWWFRARRSNPRSRFGAAQPSATPPVTIKR